MAAQRAQQTAPPEHARINHLHEPRMDRGAMAPRAQVNATEAATSRSATIPRWPRHKLATPTRTDSAPTPITTLMAARAVRSRVAKPTTPRAGTATAVTMAMALNKETAPPRPAPTSVVAISTAAVGESATKAAPTHNVGATTTTAVYPASTKTPVGTTAPCHVQSIRTVTDTEDGRTGTAATDS